MIDSRCISDGSALLEGELFRHMVRVLRLSAGDDVTLVDEAGCEHTGRIEQVAREQVTVRIGRSNRMTGDDAGILPLTLCQALPKGEKIDLILQKGTELGVHQFWLFGGRRSVARVREDQLQAKQERWRRITAEAARQCGRRTVPGVRWFPAAEDAARAADQELRLILREDERTKRLKGVLSGAATAGPVIVAIGPEGGFDPSETACFADNGFRSVSLGPRILRTETAAIAIAAILQYTGGDI
jgi:16S rRNA (uracil1498-N3)-methyltransferase